MPDVIPARSVPPQPTFQHATLWASLWEISWSLRGPRPKLDGRKAPNATDRKEAKLAAYVVVDRLAVTDPDKFSAYPKLAPPTVRTHGGRYVMPHGTQIEALEGNWKPNRIVLIEFDNAEQAKQWWDSAEYAEARGIHHEATISNIILVHGAPC